MRSAVLGIVFVSSLGILGAGCGGSSASECTVVAAGGTQAQYVVDHLLLPTSNKDYARDLNGDKRADNQLGAIIGVILSYFPDLQATVDETVAEGSLIVLLDQMSSDATFQSDECAGASVYLGQKATVKPNFDGNDTLAVDTTIPSGAFKGAITSGTFRSNDPITSKVPVTYSLKLAIIPGAPPLDLSLTGAYVQFTRSGDKVTAGQLNGAIPGDTVKTSIIPAVATLLNDQVQQKPTDSSSETILQLFDAMTTPCTNPDGTTSVGGDKKIGTCEVAENSIIKNVLAPDVQLFDATGAYKPSAENKTRDSLSLGLGFSAVKAKF